MNFHCYSFKMPLAIVIVNRKVVDRVLELVLPAFVLQSPLFIRVRAIACASLHPFYHQQYIDAPVLV